ncbi:unnamed protein product, partial [Mesorhabditis spiculigera]
MLRYSTLILIFSTLGTLAFSHTVGQRAAFNAFKQRQRALSRMSDDSGYENQAFWRGLYLREERKNDQLVWQPELEGIMDENGILYQVPRRQTRLGRTLNRGRANNYWRGFGLNL